MLSLTMPEWRNRLSPMSCEALEDLEGESLLCKYTSNEILDLIIQYRGGIASSYELIVLVREVFDIDLRAFQGRL